MPQRPLDDMRRELEASLATLAGTRVVVFACQCAADARALADRETALIPVLCAGMTPPAFVEYALRAGADGVLIAGCRRGDCAYRLGDRWTLARLARARAPRLRQGVDARRIHTVWAGPTDARANAHALARLRSQLASLPPALERRPKRREMIDE
jgi:coenzyme F420-reducing hydrogenase delta subunit